MPRLHLDFTDGTSAWVSIPLPKQAAMRWTLDIADDGECYAVDAITGTRVHLSEHCKRDVAKAMIVVRALNRIYREPAS